MDEHKQISLPVLPWMRSSVDVGLFKDRPLHLLPCLDPRLKNALQSMGISSTFPVQVAVWQETIGPGSFERDLCINSPTGSGKTLAYALPIVQMLANRAVKCLRALVVLPTRDLALQVKEVFDSIAPVVGLSVGLAVGQSSIANEISEIIKRPKLDAGICYDPEDLLVELQSSVDILVATPGRLMDHISTTKGFTLEHLNYLVVDETDRLLRESYQSWLPTVLRLACINDQDFPSPSTFLTSSTTSLRTRRISGVERGFKGKHYPRLVKMVLSATLTKDPSKLAQLDLHHPLFLTTGKRRYKLPEKLESYQIICKSNFKPLYLVALLQNLKGEKCIVFTSSVEATHRLCTLLNYFDDLLQVKIKEYSGRHRQSARSKTLDAFRKGDIQVLVCSDAMTRGMDVEGVKIVINYDMPVFIKTYIHRAGRTARAAQSGKCFTLLCKNEVKRFKKLLQKAENNSCSEHILPPNSIDFLRPIYKSALEKLKETIELEASKTRGMRFKSHRVGKVRMSMINASPGNR